MTAINNIDKAETTSNAETILGGQVDGNTLQAKEAQAGAEGRQSSKVKAESELRAAARRHGLTLKELASLMGVNYGHLCSVANGRRPWTPMMRERVMAVLGEVPGQGIVYRQGGVITSDSSFIRERAREIGLSMKELAHRVGVSAAYMTQAARGQRNMSPAVQARVEAVLGVPAKIEPAQCVYPQGGAFSGESSYIREQARAMGMNLKGLADRVGVSSAYMTQVSRGQKHMSPAVQAKVEAELGAPVRIEAAERPTVDPRALWDRMDAHGFSQNETARRAGISSALSALPDHERPAHPVGEGPGEAARGPVPAVQRGTGGSRRGQGDGLEERRAQRRGGARRRRAWGWRPESRWRHHPHRRAGALGRRGGVRLPRRVRQPGPGVGYPPGGRAGLRRYVGQAGAGRRVGTRER